MKAHLRKAIPAMLALFTLNAAAVTRYVDLNSPSPTPPYTNWSIAATNIQRAVDVAVNGDEILVTNGNYNTGGRLDLVITNRVWVDRAVCIRSLNGPTVTVIQGYQMPGTTNGGSAIRCVYISTNATLAGFTLTKGATASRAGSSNRGGGVRCASASAVVSNCIITGNSAVLGGGASGGTLINCVLTRNSADIGGGAYGAKLKNCTCVGNSASSAGGGLATIGLSTVVNSVVFGNVAPTNSNYDSGDPFFRGIFDFQYCCTTPLPTNGVGNITNAPLFLDEVGGDLRMQPTSPCINAGRNALAPSEADLDGAPRIVGGTVDIGAYEFQSPSSLLSYAWAQQYSLPTDGSVDFIDNDGDGANNWQECRSDTNPTNALSVLRMFDATNSASGLHVTWQSVSTRSYFLERATNFGDVPPFHTIATNITGESGAKTYTDTSATNGGRYFYRVGVE